MERDYQKDLEVCNLFDSAKVNFVCGLISRDFIEMARTALPWYIKRCMELEDQLTKQISKTIAVNNKLQQAEEREVVLWEALEEIEARCAIRADEDDTHFENLHEARQALTSPTQPSRYREALAVVEAARKFMECSSADMENACLCHCDKEPCPWNSLDISIIALDKAGEWAGK